VSRGLILFIGWCLLVLGGIAVAGWSAWDPFADGGGKHQGPPDRSQHHGGYGGYWGYGPMHK